MKHLSIFIILCIALVSCHNNISDKVHEKIEPCEQTNILKTNTVKRVNTGVDYKVIKKTVITPGLDDYESIEIIEIENHTIISHKWKHGYAGGMCDTHVSDCYGCSLEK